MRITKRKCKNLTDVRTIIALSKSEKYKKFPNHQRVKNEVFNSNYSWQERIAWIDRIIDWKGPRGENFEWQKVLHNSEEVANKMKKDKSERFEGHVNPAYDHGGCLSPFSDKFVGKTTKEDAIKKMRNTISNNLQNQNTRIEYYLKMGLGLCEAIEARKERQSVGRLDKFIERYGETEGKKRWQKRQIKWIESKPQTNYSQISQNLFNEIAGIISGNFYYATYNRKEMDGYKNKEYILKTKESFVRPDFICLDRKKVIEFDGDYWHNENQANLSREAKRDLSIIEQGYDVLHIKEYDYKKNPEKELQKCIDFLTQ